MTPTEHKSFGAAREAATAAANAANAANLQADAKVTATVIVIAALEVAWRQETEKTSPVGGDLSVRTGGGVSVPTGREST